MSVELAYNSAGQGCRAAAARRRQLFFEGHQVVRSAGDQLAERGRARRRRRLGSVGPPTVSAVDVRLRFQTHDSVDLRPVLRSAEINQTVARRHLATGGGTRYEDGEYFRTGPASWKPATAGTCQVNRSVFLAAATSSQGSAKVEYEVLPGSLIVRCPDRLRAPRTASAKVPSIGAGVDHRRLDVHAARPRCPRRRPAPRGRRTHPTPGAHGRSERRVQIGLPVIGVAMRFGAQSAEVRRRSSACRFPRPNFRGRFDAAPRASAGYPSPATGGPGNSRTG